jgi:hypothetical protein
LERQNCKSLVLKSAGNQFYRYFAIFDNLTGKRERKIRSFAEYNVFLRSIKRIISN